MNADEIVRALRCVQEKHRNDRLLTFQTDVSAMARDAADMIESLQAQLNDVVPVVRCGECANAKRIDKNESVYTCTHPQWTRRPHKDTFEESQLFHGLDGNDFCSYGAKITHLVNY